VLVPVENIIVRAKIAERVEHGGGWGKHTAAEVAAIRDEEIRAWHAHQASADEFGEFRSGGWGMAARLRKTQLSEYYERRRAGWGDERAEEWLRQIRDDAAEVLEAADALLGEGGMDLVGLCEPVAA
jgi:hypothetical protein